MPVKKIRRNIRGLNNLYKREKEIWNWWFSSLENKSVRRKSRLSRKFVFNEKWLEQSVELNLTENLFNKCSFLWSIILRCKVYIRMIRISIIECQLLQLPNKTGNANIMWLHVRYIFSFRRFCIPNQWHRTKYFSHTWN